MKVVLIAFLIAILNQEVSHGFFGPGHFGPSKFSVQSLLIRGATGAERMPGQTKRPP
jgi:hypothetical protein